MSKAKRTVLFVIAAVALPLLAVSGAVAGGGNFPLDPRLIPLTLDTSDRITAVIVLDPNGPVFTAPATPTGTFGTIAITKPRVGKTIPAKTAAAAFRVQPGSSLGELRYGCDLALTNPRFVEFAVGFNGVPLGGPFAGSPFDNWLSSDVLVQLFNQLGITVDIGNIPGISSAISKCVPFPRKNQTLDFMPFADILESAHINPFPPTYPDLSSNSDSNGTWAPGFLILQVNIGIWR